MFILILIECIHFLLRLASASTRSSSHILFAHEPTAQKQGIGLAPWSSGSKVAAGTGPEGGHATERDGPSELDLAFACGTVEG